MDQHEAAQIRALPGELLLLSSGEYSDYHVFGVFTCQQEITQATYEQAMATCESGLYAYQRYGHVIAWLIAQQFLRPLPYKELYLGAYLGWDEKVARLKLDITAHSSEPTWSEDL